MYKNRNDCVKYNIIKYDIKKKINKNYLGKYVWIYKYM